MKRRNLVLVAIGLAVLGLLWYVVRGRGGGGDDGGGEPPTAVAAGPAARAPAPDPMTQPRARIRGTVRDDKKAGVAGAMVCAIASSRELAEEENHEPRCATSTAGGAYAIADLPAAGYSVTASAAGFAPGLWHDGDREDFRLAAGEQRDGVDIALRGGGVAVRGVVNDIGGGPVADAQVWVGSETGRQAWAVTRTDAAGKFTAWVRPGPIWASAGAEGYADTRKRWTAPSDRLELLLTPESVLAGRVVEAGSDRPVAGAMVTASSWSGGEGGGGSARSDADGRFRITRLMPGRYKPSAQATGRWGEARASVLLGLGQTVEDVVIEVHPAFVVAGTVVIEDGGKPCEQGSVTLEDRARDLDESAAIEAGGQVTFKSTFPGTYQVSVHCEGHLGGEYPPVKVVDADVTGQTWTVTAGATLLVEVTAGGAPVAEAWVRAEPRRPDRRSAGRGWWGGFESTDESGTAEIAGLAAGSYEVTVDTRDRIDPEPRDVEVTGTGETRVKFELATGGSIQGVVVEVGGQPVPGATVSARSGRWGGWRDRVMTGDDGSFRLDGLSPGEHRVVATRGMWQELRRPGAGDDDVQGEKVSVAEGKVAEVRLVVESQSEKISGTVVDGNGAPVTDAFVAAQRESEAAGRDRAWTRRAARWGWDRQAVATDGEGRFTVGQLSAGSYTVRAYRRGGGEGVVEGVRAGTTVQVTIRPTGAIAGRVTLSDGGTPERFSIEIEDDKSGFERDEEFFRTGGAFTMTDVPAGAFKVTAQAAEGTATTDVGLSEGEQRQNVELELAARLTLTGRVVELGTGKPIEGMQVMARAAQGSARQLGGWGDPGQISGADGRFTIEGAPRGRVTIVAFPRARESSPWSFGQLAVDAPADATTHDVGDLEILRRRLPPRERPGDLGFQLNDVPFGADPATVTLQVARIRPGGPAQGTGLEVGDVIVAVDGIDVRGNNSARYRALTAVPAGTAVRLTVARGATIPITAARPL